MFYQYWAEMTHQRNGVSSSIIPIVLCNELGKEYSTMVRVALASYPYTFTAESPLLLSNVLKEVPICAIWAGVMRQVGYVGLLFCGSFYSGG